MSLLELKDGPSATIEEVARDYSPHYMAALESTTEHEFLGADTDLNVFALEKESVAAGSMTDEDSLSPRGVFHLGEMVTRFQRGKSCAFTANSSVLTFFTFRLSCSTARRRSRCSKASSRLHHVGRFARSRD